MSVKKDPFADRRRLSDFAPAGGELTKMEDIANRDLILVSAVPERTEYGDGYRMQLANLENTETYTVLTSGVVLCRQLASGIEAADEPIVKFTKRKTSKGRDCWIIE